MASGYVQLLRRSLAIQTFIFQNDIIIKGKEVQGDNPKKNLTFKSEIDEHALVDCQKKGKGRGDGKH